MDGDLTSAQLDALLDRGSSDREVLESLLQERFRRWPWWDRTWHVVEISQVSPRQITEWLHQVTVDGTVGRGTMGTLPMSVFLRVAGERIDRFEVRLEDVLIGPPIRHDDPHPFGSIISALMDRRGLARREMARRCGLSESTVAKMRAGHMVPRGRRLLDDMAAALEMPVGDLMAIAGLPEAP